MLWLPTPSALPCGHTSYGLWAKGTTTVHAAQLLLQDKSQKNASLTPEGSASSCRRNQLRWGLSPEQNGEEGIAVPREEPAAAPLESSSGRGMRNNWSRGREVPGHLAPAPGCIHAGAFFPLSHHMGISAEAAAQQALTLEPKAPNQSARSPSGALLLPTSNLTSTTCPAFPTLKEEATAGRWDLSSV